eukprot:5603567-Pyramimonas_sp.AAC.1
MNNIGLVDGHDRNNDFTRPRAAFTPHFFAPVYGALGAGTTPASAPQIYRSFLAMATASVA